MGSLYKEPACKKAYEAIEFMCYTRPKNTPIASHRLPSSPVVSHRLLFDLTVESFAYSSAGGEHVVKDRVVESNLGIVCGV